MTRDAAIALVLARLRRTGDTALAALIIPELTLLQQAEAEGGVLGQSWFLLRYAELTLSVDRLQAEVPEDFISFPQDMDECLFLPAAIDGDPTAMVGATRFLPGETFTGQLDTRSGAGWSLQDRTINFARALNVGDVPVIIYYGGEATNELAYGAPGQPAANRWLTQAPDWIIAKLCHLFASQYLKYDDADTRFMPKVVDAERRLITQHTLQEQGARRQVLNQYYSRAREARGGATVT